jgi:hypothetical protein
VSGAIVSLSRMSQVVGFGPKELVQGGRPPSTAGRMVALAIACGLLVACTPTEPDLEGAAGSVGDRSEISPRRPSGAEQEEICLRGRFTEEGVECRAMRGPAGRLYTLVGDLGDGPAAGGEACVCGWVAELSSCMQGTTVVATRIGPPDSCP